MRIIGVKGVLRRTVCSDWRKSSSKSSDSWKLTTNHQIQSHDFSFYYQSQHRPEHHDIRLNFKPSLDSEDGFRSECWYVSLYRQPFSRLLSSGRSSSIEECNWVQTIFSRNKLFPPLIKYGHGSVNNSESFQFLRPSINVPWEVLNLELHKFAIVIFKLVRNFNPFLAFSLRAEKKYPDSTVSSLWNIYQLISQRYW